MHPQILIQNPNGLTIQRVDGGWLVIAPKGEGSSLESCRTPRDVMDKVIEWLDAGLGVMLWDESIPAGEMLTSCMLAEVLSATGGSSWVITYVMPNGPHPQFVRFNATDVLVVTARWLGFVPAVCYEEASPTLDGFEDDEHTP